ncbi:hypothetical protein ACQJBY_027593 [Aegilops geniculata]
MDGVAVPHQETNPHAIPDPHVTSFLLIFLPWWWHMWLGDCVDLGDLVDSGNAVTEMSRENAGCTAQTCRSWGCGGIEGGGGGRVSPRREYLLRVAVNSCPPAVRTSTKLRGRVRRVLTDVDP